jgi:hypothetical protein
MSRIWGRIDALRDEIAAALPGCRIKGFGERNLTHGRYAYAWGTGRHSGEDTLHWVLERGDGGRLAQVFVFTGRTDLPTWARDAGRSADEYAEIYIDFLELQKRACGRHTLTGEIPGAMEAIDDVEKEG